MKLLLDDALLILLIVFVSHPPPPSPPPPPPPGVPTAFHPHDGHCMQIYHFQQINITIGTLHSPLLVRSDNNVL